MSDVLVDQGTQDPAPPPGQQPTEPHLGWALAGMSAGAGVIHIAMTPVHAATAWQESLGFAAAGWFQLVTAGIVLAEPRGQALLRAGRRRQRPVHPGVDLQPHSGPPVRRQRQRGRVRGRHRHGVRHPPGRRDPGRRPAGAGAREALDRPARPSPVRSRRPRSGHVGHHVARRRHPQPRRRAAAEPTGLDAEAIKVDADPLRHGLQPLGLLGRSRAARHRHPLGRLASRRGRRRRHVCGRPRARRHRGSRALPAPPPRSPIRSTAAGPPGLDELVSATGLAATSEVDAASLVTRLSEAIRGGLRRLALVAALVRHPQPRPRHVGHRLGRATAAATAATSAPSRGWR